MKILDKEELINRAKKIKMVAFDVDGVLTDGSISYTSAGDEIKTFNAKDGQGMVMLHRAGLYTIIITARTSPIVERRAKDIGITKVFQGQKNKLIALESVMDEFKISFDEIAYVGDDLPDICILEKVALPCCPADAVEEVKNTVVFVSQNDGGRGAVREISDLILGAKNN